MHCSLYVLVGLSIINIDEMFFVELLVTVLLFAKRTSCHLL